VSLAITSELYFLTSTIICIKYKTNGIFQEIFENHKQLESVFIHAYIFISGALSL